MAHLLECNPNVKMFATQPEQIQIKIGGKIRRYTPDFLVLHHSGFAEYIEVHHEYRTDDDYRIRLDHFDRYTRKILGVGIRLVVVNKLHKIEVVNLALLARYSTPCQVPLKAVPYGQVTLRELIDHLQGIAECAISAAYGLLAAKVFHFNHHEPLTINSVLNRVPHA